jgi:Tfp pilus assembly protein PilV
MGRRSRPRDEGGFVLMESMVAISLITVILAALGTFTLNSVALTSQLRARQAAAQIASSAVATLGAVPATDLVTGRDATNVASQFAGAPGEVRPSLTGMSQVSDAAAKAGAGATATISTSPVVQVLNNITFSVNTYLGRCFTQADSTDCRPTGAGVEQLRAVVAVTWQDKGCGSTSCAFVTTSLINQDDDPIFNLNTANPPTVPAVQGPGNQTSTVGATVSLQLATQPNAGVPPLTWQVTSGTLPAGLILSASGLVSGVPTLKAASTPLTVTVTDAFGRTGAGSFAWTIVAAPTVTTPNPQTSTQGTAVSLPVASTCPNAPCAFTIDGAPAGLTINATTGVVSGTPTTPGVYSTVTVTITDADDVAATTSTFTWTVLPAPTIGAIAALRATVTSTESVPIAWTCPTANCTLTLVGTIPGVGLSATTPRATNNLTTTLAVAGTSGTTYLTGIVQTTAVTSPATSRAYTPTVRISNGTSTATSAPGDWIAYAKAMTATVVARTVNVGAVVNVALTYVCPNAPCTIGLTARVPGLGLSTNPANTATNNTTSLVVASSSGTVYINGTVSATAVASGQTQAWPVTVQITDADAVTTASTATWTASKAPRIADPGSQAMEPNQNLSLQITASCPNGGCTWQAAVQVGWWDPTWYPVTISASGLITGTNVGAGSYVMRVTVRDATLASDTVTFPLTVQTFAFVVPDQTTPRPASGTTVATLDVSTFVQPLAAGYSYTVTGQPAWLVLSPNGTFTATIAPTTPLGTTTMTVTVTSRASSTSTVSDTSFRWTIQ